MKVLVGRIGRVPPLGWLVATIETPAVIARILRHLGLPSEPVRLAPARGPLTLGAVRAL